MPPAEMPWAAWARKRALRRGLKSLRYPKSFIESYGEQTLEVFCLQEVNPVEQITKRLKEELGFEAFSLPVQVGIKAGHIGWPPLLNEGLALFWRGPLKDSRTESIYLSGQAQEISAPGGIPVTVQLEERRGAQLLTGVWKKRRFTFVNVHLHHGPAATGNAQRRAEEVDRLMNFIEPFVAESDASFVCGDFNCEHGDSELAPLRAAGFEEILGGTGEPLYTWDPGINPRCRKNADLNDEPENMKWDKARHQFDHIFFKARGKSWGKRPDSRAPFVSRIERIFDTDAYGAWVSDHFGLLVDVSWPAEKM